MKYKLISSEPGPSGKYIHEIVDLDTGVHYLLAHDIGITPRLNADGTIMINKNIRR